MRLAFAIYEYAPPKRRCRGRPRSRLDPEPHLSPWFQTISESELSGRTTRHISGIGFIWNNMREGLVLVIVQPFNPSPTRQGPEDGNT
jgi:hypothetical protein